MSAHHPRVLLPVLLLLLPAACGGSPGSDVPVKGAPVEQVSDSVRPPLRVAPGEAPLSVAETVKSFRVDAQNSQRWEVGAPKTSGARSKRVPLPVEGQPDDAMMLHLLTKARWRILLPAFVPRADFNQVAVTVLPLKTDDVRVALRAGAETLFTAKSKRVIKGADPETLLFDMPLHEVDGDVSHIEVFIGDISSEFGLISVDLLYRPLHDRLPSADEGPGMVGIGGEWRSAVGVSNDQALETAFRVQAGDVMRFSHGLPPELRWGRGTPTLRLTLQDERGEPRMMQFAIDPDPAGPLEWTTEEVALDGLEGAASARFELFAGQERTAVVALAGPVLLRREAKPKTVILVTSDTHRADHLGASPTGVPVRTPFLDSLAERGVLFTDCFSTTNITNPSHVSIMTAYSPRDTGVVDNNSPLASAARTLAEAFREQGFATIASVSAPHLNPTRSGLGQGFDRFHAPPDDDRDSTETIAGIEPWLEDMEGLPLFVWLHVFDAHAPYQPPPNLSEIYYPKGKSPYDESLPELQEHQRAIWDPLVRDVKYIIAQYRGEVTYLDGQLAGFLGHERFEDALIAITSDHGESLGNHGIYFEHKGLFPDTLAVPMILAWPGAPAGTQIDRPVLLTDLPRTLLDLAGLEHAEFEGRNMLQGFPEGEQPPPRFMFASHAHSAAVELGGWMLIMHLSPGRYSPDQDATKTHELELYNLVRDPECQDNLVDSNKRKTEGLRKILVDWLLSAQAEGWNESNAVSDIDVLANLVTLGYTAGTRSGQMNDWFDGDCDCSWCEKYR